MLTIIQVNLECLINTFAANQLQTDCNKNDNLSFIHSFSVNVSGAYSGLTLGREPGSIYNLQFTSHACLLMPESILYQDIILQIAQNNLGCHNSIKQMEQSWIKICEPQAQTSTVSSDKASVTAGFYS